MNDITIVENVIPAGDYELDFLIQKNGTLVLSFLSEQSKVSINYGYQYIMYRGSDEGDRLRTINFYLKGKDKNFFKDNLMFMVTNSDFVEWIKKEQYGMFESREMVHHMLLLRIFQ